MTDLHPHGPCEFCDNRTDSMCDTCNLACSRGEILRFAQEIQEVLAGTGDLGLCCRDLIDETDLFDTDVGNRLAIHNLRTKVNFLCHLMREVRDEIGGLFGVNVRQEWLSRAD